MLELERLGEPHLELSPGTILLEAKSLVYVQPFSSLKVTTTYSAPEELQQEKPVQPATCGLWMHLRRDVCVIDATVPGRFRTQELTKMFEVLKKLMRECAQRSPKSRGSSFPYFFSPRLRKSLEASALHTLTSLPSKWPLRVQ